jgi:DNA-directed RNA polymerase I subunit RPA1
MDYEEESTKTEIKTGQDLLNDELMASGEPAKRRLHFLSNVEDSKSFGRIVDYKFDADKEQWCELTMDFDVSAKKPDLVNVIRKSSERGVIHQVQNIKKGFVVEKDGKFSLQTDGINVEMMYKFDKLLDLNRLRVNSIHDMARYYGIEAANKTIVQEVKNVFGVYGIDVDYRHLSLIADYMTIDGGYRPFNRIGIGNNPSPLQQCSFETAIPFLRAAILSGKQDTLSSPSACIVTGKHVRVGTGSVHLQYKMC